MGKDRTSEPQANHERLTVGQAAATLGITEGAVRSRIKRGTLRTTKEGGTVYVLWGDGLPATYKTTNVGAPRDQSEFVASLQDQIRYLREQLDAEREARTEERRRHDTVLAQLSAANAERARTIRELEAPQGERESPETVEEESERVEENGTSETVTPRSRPSNFLPPLQDKLALRDYVVAVAVPIAWVVFGRVITWLLTVLDAPRIVGEPVTFVLDLVPFSVLLLLSGFWLGLRRRGGLSRTTLSIIGLLVAAVDVAIAVLIDYQYNVSFFLVSIILDGFSIYLLVVAGALLGKAVQRRGLKRGIYGDDPAASTPRVQSRRAVSNLVIGSGVATIIAALIQAVTVLLDKS